MSDLRNRSRKYWELSSKIIQDYFGVETPPSPNSVQIINSDKSIRFGGQYFSESGLLQITQDVLDNEIPFEGLVHRECLFHSLSSELCDEARHDVASCFARTQLRKNDRDRWISSWMKLPTRRLRANLVYNSFETMDWMYKLGGQKELVGLVHEFESMSRYGKKLEFEEYFEYIIRRTQDIVVKLSQTEIKIVEALQNQPDVSYREVSKKTGLSESWISTKINRLKEMYVLAELTTAPFSRIGIRTFHVLLAAPSWEDPTCLIKNCPFLYNVQPILNGPWQVIARLAIPDSTNNTKAIDQMVSILQRNGIAVDVSETHSVGITNSFYHYNMRTRQWDIPWVAMEGWGHRIQTESLHCLVDRIDQPAKTTDHYLDSIDMNILDLIHQGISSTRLLRKELSLNQSKLTSRVRKLRTEGLIRKTWAVYNIGLVERVALRATDKTTANMLDLWSRELPRGYLRYEENRNLLMMTELPLGDSSKLMDVLRKLKWPVSVSAIGSGIWGHWNFPTHLWDIDRQRWNSPTSGINSWLNELIINCEGIDSPDIDSYHPFLKTG